MKERVSAPAERSKGIREVAAWAERAYARFKRSPVSAIAMAAAIGTEGCAAFGEFGSFVAAHDMRVKVGPGGGAMGAGAMAEGGIDRNATMLNIAGNIEAYEPPPKAHPETLAETDLKPYDPAWRAFSRDRAEAREIAQKWAMPPSVVPPNGLYGLVFDPAKYGKGKDIGKPIPERTQAGRELIARFPHQVTAIYQAPVERMNDGRDLLPITDKVLLAASLVALQRRWTAEIPSPFLPDRRVSEGDGLGWRWRQEFQPVPAGLAPTMVYDPGGYGRNPRMVPGWEPTAEASRMAADEPSLLRDLVRSTFASGLPGRAAAEPGRWRSFRKIIADRRMPGGVAEAPAIARLVADVQAPDKIPAQRAGVWYALSADGRALEPMSDVPPGAAVRMDQAGWGISLSPEEVLLKSDEVRQSIVAADVRAVDAAAAEAQYAFPGADVRIRVFHDEANGVSLALTVVDAPKNVAKPSH